MGIFGQIAALGRFGVPKFSFSYGIFIFNPSLLTPMMHFFHHISRFCLAMLRLKRIRARQNPGPNWQKLALNKKIDSKGPTKRIKPPDVRKSILVPSSLYCSYWSFNHLFDAQSKFGDEVGQAERLSKCVESYHSIALQRYRKSS